MQYLNPFFAEQPVEVEILYIQSPAHFPGTVIMYPRTPGAVAAVGNIELMPVTPGASLVNFNTFICHMPAGEVIPDEPG